MHQELRLSKLLATGFVVEHSLIEPDRVTMCVRSAVNSCTCLACGKLSSRVQSRYWRRAADLPLSGKRVELKVLVRRFRRGGVLCGRRIFAERFVGGSLAPRSRRTERLERNPINLHRILQR